MSIMAGSVQRMMAILRCSRRTSMDSEKQIAK
jgi:hypothetical protein